MNDNTLYMQVYRKIKDEINTGNFKKGEYLPSENDLCKRYSVSRITIRRSIEELEKRGLVRSMQGKGTLVCSKERIIDLANLQGFKEDAVAEGNVPTSIVIKFEKKIATIDIARKLNINEKDEYFYLERLRLINGTVQGLHKTYIISEVGKEIDIENWTPSSSLYEFYHEIGVDITKADEFIQVLKPDKELAILLNIKREDAIFYRERITYDSYNKPIELSENYYIAKEHRYFVQMRKG